MISLTINSRNFQKTMNNIVQYSYGFLDGAQKGKKIFLKNLGFSTVEVLKKYIDIEARSNPSALHHVYEWYQTGSPSARLFEINYTVSNQGLSIMSTFKQSKTVSRDANVPFYNKAKIMEDGIPVTITPKKSVLVFKDSGNTIFTRKSITITNPGGDEVVGSFENIFDQFINVYFRQSFLKSSGLYEYIKRPTLYKKNIKTGSRSGRPAGVSTGFKWIANARIEAE